MIPRGLAALLVLAASLPAQESLEDPVGNWRARIPAGWRIAARPGDPDSACRLGATVRDAGGELRAHLIVHVYRAKTNAAAREPLDKLLGLALEAGALEDFYGRDVPRDIPLDEKQKLGKIEASAGFQLDILTKGERARGASRTEALTLARVGSVPPLTYIVRGMFDTTGARREQLIEEWRAFVSSFEAIRPEPRPALPVFDDKLVEVTTTDASLKQKDETLQVGVQDSRKEQKGLVVDYTMPQGFRRVRARAEPGQLTVAAVDEDHNWAYVDLYVVSWKKVAAEGKEYIDPQREVKKNLAEWDATAAPKNMRRLPLGKLTAWGYHGVAGVSDGIPGTESYFATDEDRWRIACRVRTCAQGQKIFGTGIETFLKSLRFRRE